MKEKKENWLIRAPGRVDRFEARFSGVAFAPHRHDAYAICVTLMGVQSFDYRGATRHALPGQLVVLHPDELHDGRAGDDEAFQYRAIYIEPASILDALNGGALPFVRDGVSENPRLKRALLALLGDMERSFSALEYDDALYDLAAALRDEDGGETRRSERANYAAAQIARAYIEAHLDRNLSLGELEEASGHDRWRLSRDFRKVFGTSPYRYLTMRRLDRARGLLAEGRGIADVASLCGFSDQSHFGRHFKKAYGMTPKAWLYALNPLHDRSIPA